MLGLLIGDLRVAVVDFQSVSSRLFSILTKEIGGCRTSKLTASMPRCAAFGHLRITPAAKPEQGPKARLLPDGTV